MKVTITYERGITHGVYWAMARDKNGCILRAALGTDWEQAKARVIEKLSDESVPKPEVIEIADR